MPRNKNIILIAVIVIMFGAAVVILYKGFVKKPASGSVPPLGTPTTDNSVTTNPVTTNPIAGSSPTASPVPTEINNGRILPFGNRLDLTNVKKYNADGKLFNYPTTSPDQIGPVLNDIIVPKAAK